MVTYDYDYRGNRVTETIGSTPTFYLWDEFSRYGDVILETGDNAGTLYRKMDYLLADGMLISQSNTSNAVHYFLQDAQGSTIALADSAGTVSAGNNYRYNAFGELQGSYDPVGLGTKYLYTGQYSDALNTELYNLRARQYDPSIGRFLTRDTWAYNLGNPIELNRYVYTANNPVTYVDPSGYTGSVSYASIKQSVIQVATKPLKFVARQIVLGGIGAVVGFVATSAILALFDLAVDSLRALVGSRPDCNNCGLEYFYKYLGRTDILISGIVGGMAIGGLNAISTIGAFIGNPELLRLANDPYSSQSFMKHLNNADDYIRQSAFINGFAGSQFAMGVSQLFADGSGEPDGLQVLINLAISFFEGMVNHLTSGINRNDSILLDILTDIYELAPFVNTEFDARALARGSVYVFSNMIAIWGTSAAADWLRNNLRQ